MDTTKTDKVKKSRQVTFMDKDGSISEMLSYVRECLQSTQTVLTLDDTIVIKSIIVSAYNKYKREKPEKVGSLENLFQ